PVLLLPETLRAQSGAVNLGCELRQDGSKGGFLRYGYDGMDFISFNKETPRWVTAQPLARKVKEEWEEDPRWSQESKVFLEETCIAWLQRYLSYKKATLEKIGEWQKGGSPDQVSMGSPSPILSLSYIANPPSPEKGQEVSHILLRGENYLQCPPK
uniref:MHC class I-like antigen recognition-like domain-containing protein n=1 Tax=Pseudonaja textilis TaxID=8673 RepID=A0A670Z571_PSETE